MENTEENDGNPTKKDLPWSEKRSIDDLVFNDVRKIEREIDKRYEQRVSQQVQIPPPTLEKKNVESEQRFEPVEPSIEDKIDIKETAKQIKDPTPSVMPETKQKRLKQKTKKHIVIGKRKKKTKKIKGLKNLFSQYFDHFIAKLQKPDFSLQIRGEVVYLEETGERLGVVHSVIYDDKKDIVGYEIKDDKSQAMLRFPIEQFTDDKNGLILAPRWYLNATKTIAKFEFKERASPELVHLFSENISAESNPDLLHAYDPEFTECIQEGKSLRALLLNQRSIYDQQRLVVNDKLMELTKKRLIDDIDRKDFSEAVMEQRKKSKLLDITSIRCAELLQRLDATVFGKISKNQNSSMSSEQYSPPLGPLKDIPVKEKTLHPTSLDQKQESLTTIIAELIEDKITEDIKKQLIKNQLSSFEKINAYGEMRKQQDGEDEYIRTLQSDLQQKNEIIKRLQEEILKK